MTQLEGVKALITGAAAGLGLATAKMMVSRGAQVTLGDVDEDGARKAAEELGENASAVKMDVTNEADVENATNAAAEQWGGLNVVINNAGIEIGKPLVEHTREEFDRLMSINVTGVFLGIKYATPVLAAGGGGAIVNMSSVAGVGGAPLLGAYCASKAAVVNMTRVAAIELRQVGIRVNAVCPAFIDTKMVERLVEPFEAAVGMPFDEVLKLKQGRIGTPEEVAETVCFLASEESSWVTGTPYILDGGLTASLL